MNRELTIRLATLDDALQLASIYAPYVAQTAISFEYIPPTAEEFRQRIEGYRHQFPYLVAEHNGRIVGYCYGAAYGVRAAYRWSVELSVYVDRSCRKMGVGRQLYAQMERILKAQNVVNLYAQVAGVEVEDEYLSHDSLKFHQRMGFELVGRMHKAGYKFGRWYDMLTLEKAIAPHHANQPEVIPFDALSPAVRCNLGLSST